MTEEQELKLAEEKKQEKKENKKWRREQWEWFKKWMDSMDREVRPFVIGGTLIIFLIFSSYTMGTVKDLLVDGICNLTTVVTRAIGGYEQKVEVYGKDKDKIQVIWVKHEGGRK